MSNVVDRTGAQIIQYDDPLATCDQSLREMGPDKAGASSNKGSHNLLQTFNLQKQAVAQSAPHAPHRIFPSNLLAFSTTAAFIRDWHPTSRKPSLGNSTRTLRLEPEAISAQPEPLQSLAAKLFVARPHVSEPHSRT